jgi:hypothetical protein
VLGFINKLLAAKEAGCGTTTKVVVTGVVVVDIVGAGVAEVVVTAMVVVVGMGITDVVVTVVVVVGAGGTTFTP